MRTDFAVLIKIASHSIHIKVMNERIHCFKYNERTCDFAVFTFDEQFEASDYILEPLPTIYYEVSVKNE